MRLGNMPVFNTGSIEFCTFLGLLLIFLIKGCEPFVKPTGPALFKALTGTSVTFGIAYGYQTSQVYWLRDEVTIAYWTVGSSTPPEVAPKYVNILKLEEDGSLTFVNVTLNLSGTYDVTVVQVGTKEGKTSFKLIVYEKIDKVSLHTWPNDAVESNGTFTLYYSTVKGEAEEVQWFFNGAELQNGSRYSLSGKNLSISNLNRMDKGLYNITLKNPFSFGTSERNITVLYGPDHPTLDVSPTKDFFVMGDSLSLSCRAQGEPLPSVSWAFMGQAVPSTQPGLLHLTNAQTNQSGVYTCILKNSKTGAQLNRSVTVNIYERPAGSPWCSVQAVNGNSALRYRCQWPGGTPEAQLSFPTLNTSSSGPGELSITVNDLQGLDGNEVTCLIHHPLYQGQCNVTARRTAGFLPSVSAAVNEEGKVVAMIKCLAVAMPNAMVTWTRSGQNVSSLQGFEISSDTTWLHIVNFNFSTVQLYTYMCTAVNPLGSQSQSTTLSGPAISRASFFSNEEGTVITVTWEVPDMAIVTGFQIQVKGPDLASTNKTVRRNERAREYHTVQVRPSSSRSTDISGLDPKTRYYFRVIPMAGRMAGEPSEQLIVGPGGGLSGSAIAGIAAGIPCSLLVLLLLCLVFPCFLYRKRNNREARYPVSRVVEKAVTTLSSPHQLLTGGLKMPPDYSLHQPPGVERSSPLPSDPPPVRMATTV